MPRASKYSMTRWRFVTPQLDVSWTRTEAIVAHGTTRLPPLLPVYSRLSHGAACEVAASLTRDGENHGVLLMRTSNFASRTLAVRVRVRGRGGGGVRG